MIENLTRETGKYLKGYLDFWVNIINLIKLAVKKLWTCYKYTIALLSCITNSYLPLMMIHSWLHPTSDFSILHQKNSALNRRKWKINKINELIVKFSFFFCYLTFDRYDVLILIIDTIRHWLLGEYRSSTQ